MSNLVPGICTQCGSRIEVNPEQDAAVCDHCGTPFIIEKAIKNYKIQSVNTMSISNSVVQISDEQSANGRLKAAEAYIKLHKYDCAETEYLKVTELTPQDYKGWWGVIVSRTFGFTKRIKDEKTEFPPLDDYLKSVKTLASDDVRNGLVEKYNEYKELQINTNNKEKNSLETQIKDNTNKLENIEREKEELSLLYGQLQKKTAELKMKDAFLIQRVGPLSSLFGFFSFIFFLCCFAAHDIATVVILASISLAFAVAMVVISIKRRQNRMIINNAFEDSVNKGKQLCDQIDQLSNEKNRVLSELEKEKHELNEYS